MNGTVFGYKKQITMRMKMGNKILWLMSCLLFAGKLCGERS